MALEEFLLDLCEESVTAALLVRAVPLPKVNWKRQHPNVMLDRSHLLTLGSCRLSGSSRPIFMISQQIRIPKLSKHVVEYTTRSNTLCLGSPIPLVMRKSRITFYPSLSCPASFSPVSPCPCSLGGLAPLPSHRRANLSQLST